MATRGTGSGGSAVAQPLVPPRGGVHGEAAKETIIVSTTTRTLGRDDHGRASHAHAKAHERATWAAGIAPGNVGRAPPAIQAQEQSREEVPRYSMTDEQWRAKGGPEKLAAKRELYKLEAAHRRERARLRELIASYPCGDVAQSQGPVPDPGNPWPPTTGVTVNWGKAGAWPPPPPGPYMGPPGHQAPTVEQALCTLLIGCPKKG